VQTLTEHASLAEARVSLHEHRLSAMPVLNRQGELQGMLSLHDLLLAEADTQAVSQCMQRQAPTCRADWPVTYLLQMLTDSDVHRLPVV
ncbi:CBS domain-containing protein, partial [Devosia neptuniae]